MQNKSTLSCFVQFVEFQPKKEHARADKRSYSLAFSLWLSHLCLFALLSDLAHVGLVAFSFSHIYCNSPGNKLKSEDYVLELNLQNHTSPKSIIWYINV
jgi:hypothetical protein